MRQLTVPTRSDGFSHVDGMTLRQFNEALSDWFDRQDYETQREICDQINEHEARKAAA